MRLTLDAKKKAMENKMIEKRYSKKILTKRQLEKLYCY